MIKSILFPFESHRDNRNAFVYAAKLARKWNTEIIMLASCSTPSKDSSNPGQHEQSVRSAWAEVNDEIQGLQGYYLSRHANAHKDLKIKFEYRFVERPLLNEIFEIMAKEPIGAVVLNQPRSKSSFDRILNRDIKEVLEFGTVPVMLIPEGEHYQSIKKIVYAADFYELKNEVTGLNNTIALAELYHSKVHFLHVSSGQSIRLTKNGIYDKVKALVEENADYTYSTESGNDVLKAASTFIKENTVDLVVVVKQTSESFNALFHNEFTDQLYLSLKKPVFFLKESQTLKTHLRQSTHFFES